MQKNKIILLTLASLFGFSITSAQAKSLACDYKDTLYVNSATAPANTHLIGQIKSWGDLHVVEVSATSFALQGFCSTSGQGGVEVTFGTTPDNACTLTIRDGQFYQDPLVENIKCKGKLRYSGITYDGIFTYHYKLHFDM